MSSGRPCGNPKEIHGNKAKIDKSKKVMPEFAAMTNALADRKDNETLVVNDENVAHAKHFVEENKK
jgi:hypothetical protein